MDVFLYEGGAIRWFLPQIRLRGFALKIMKLQDFFEAHPSIALGFSGGVDSSYLLYEAIKNQVDVGVFYVKTQFQPAFEYEDARRVGRELGVKIHVISLDILEAPRVVENPSDRCYYCKQVLFGAICQEAGKMGYTQVMDGTNASDDVSDRPGIKALQEFQVYSPLRLCGLTKAEIRKRSREVGLFTWDKPSYACLATRIRTGMPITNDQLNRVEQAEEYLKSLGFTDFRVRIREEGALLQIRKPQFDLYESKKAQIQAGLRRWFGKVVEEPEERG